MKIGFIGLGNVGGKLAGSLLRHGFELWVRDLDHAIVAPFLEKGAIESPSPKQMAELCDMVITCLPSPAASAAVMEAEDGILAGISEGKIWAEMSTSDAAEVRRLGAIMGRRILHTGELGSASVLKVVTNYLASANLATLCEALVTAKAAGMDLNTAYEAIRISSGNSFVHETESQVILNGSRDINFTMDLVVKDVGLFQALAERAGLALEISPLLLDIFKDGLARYGAREFSPNIVKRLEEACGVDILAPGFPPEMIDNEPEQPGYEVIPTGRA